MINSPASEPNRPAHSEWPIAVLGVPFDQVTIQSAVDRIDAMISDRTPRYVVTPNVDFLVQARFDSELRRILADAHLVVCDGKPLVWASRWLGNALPERVAGADLAPALLRRAVQRGWKIFLLGGADGVGEEAARRIAAAYPGLPEVAHYSPPYRPLPQMNHAEIIERLKAAQPDIVLVCFGCPKQEKWIYQYHRDSGVPLMIGAGATVDFLAGRVSRAPQWMRNVGLEWIYRLSQEPRRLFKRYAGDILHFFPALVAQRWSLRPMSTVAGDKAPSAAETYYGLKIEACETLHREDLDRTAAFWKRALRERGHCVVDLSAVQSIDSTGLAFLAMWQKRLAAHQRNLVLYRPSPAVLQALDRMRLTEQFVIPVDDASPQDLAPRAKGAA